MPTIALVYTSRHGQTRRIAERIATTLRARRFAVDVIDLDNGLAAEFDGARYQAAIVAASVHIGKHAPLIVRFVRDHLERLNAMPNAFLSVSLSAYGAVDASAGDKRRTSAQANVDKMIGEFLRDTGWTPNAIHRVPGALLYLQYGFFVRMMMRFISTLVGASTDTSRDHDYTDWAAVERIANEVGDRTEAARMQAQLA